MMDPPDHPRGKEEEKATAKTQMENQQEKEGEEEKKYAEYDTSPERKDYR